MDRVIRFCLRMGWRPVSEYVNHKAIENEVFNRYFGGELSGISDEELLKMLNKK